MKLFKKAAALFFCLTLALSVMAVTALADDDAELLALADPQPNTKFEVTLEKIAPVQGNDNFTDISAATTSNILDRDANSVNGYEVKKTESVTFAIKLAYNGDKFTPTTDQIDGFQFTYVPGLSSDTDAASNKGVEITGLRIGGQDVKAMRTGASGAYANIYAFGSLGSTTGDIPMPGSTPAIIGTVTFSFTGAAQDVALTPTIKTMLIQVRGVQNPQWIVKAPSNGSSDEWPLGDGVYIASGDPGTGYTMPASGGNGGSGYSGYEDGTASTYPIWVNPHYNITVEHFQANATTGVAEKITSGDNATSTVTYYFDTDDTPNDGKTYNTLTNEDPIDGYTFKGWMVTEDSTNSATWDAYVQSTDSAWNKTTSYPKVTNAPGTVAAATAWYAAHYTDNAVETDAAEWDGKNDATPTAADYYTIAARTSALSTQADGTTASGVKFIPVASSGDTTPIPSYYVGPITLTPVYTRDVYTVTFNADTAANYSLGSKARFGDTLAQDNSNRTRTDYYTIEDLASGSSAVDFLNIRYNTVEQPLTVDNQNLQKPGYKFVGWVGSGAGYNEYDASSANTGYKWGYDYTTRVNQTKVIRNASPHQMKCIGNLMLTAEWELDIYFAKVKYHFGGADNSLILVAVPNANRVAEYTYKCESKDANNAPTPFAMFEIPAGDQKAAYTAAAVTASSDTNNNPDVNNGYTITSGFFGESGTYYSAYHLFAYIADATDTTEAKITLDETTLTTGNIGEATATFAYNGDVDGSNFVSVADFGNVDTLLNDNTATTSGIFSITTRAGVEARLKADYTTSTDSGDPTGDTARAFASIADVKRIYNVMGYTAQLTPTNP